MPTLDLPKDWPYRAKRALRRLGRRSVAASCFWCGHTYRCGEYGPEAEDAHLLQCPEFPEDGKQQIRERQRRASTK